MIFKYALHLLLLRLRLRLRLLCARLVGFAVTVVCLNVEPLGPCCHAVTRLSPRSISFHSIPFWRSFCLCMFYNKVTASAAATTTTHKVGDDSIMEQSSASAALTGCMRAVYVCVCVCVSCRFALFFIFFAYSK